ncbi:MAG: T9SS type A sorting domain-containing protein [Saprospiraceae bacterium]
MNRYLLNWGRFAVSLTENSSRSFLALLLFAFTPFIAQAQCTTNPGIVSSGGTASYFDIDDDGANDFAIVRNSPFNVTRLIVLGDEAAVFLGTGSEVVNVAENTNFNGSESSYSSGSGFQQFELDQGVNNWLIVFKYEVTLSGGVQAGIQKLGFLKIAVIGQAMIVEEYGTQATNDTDGILAGDCSSLANSLPIELSYFNASSDDAAIQLTWETQAEKSNLGFEIQRSLNGRDFENIAWVAGAGDSFAKLQYQYEDRALRSNISYYYRLKNVNYDGSFELSPIRVAKLVNGRKDAVSPFFPNPVMDQVTKLQFVAEEDQTVQITLYNAMGKQVKFQEAQLSIGGNLIELRTSDLTSGNYFAMIQMGDDLYQQKLIISK